jgi:uncharacterized membrane protein YbaN (DUF454 family)
MNNQEAKLILQAYRPGGQDASDPLFAEALEQCRRDPELQKWFAEESALDSHIQSKLQKAITIPSDLRANLLAQRKIVRPTIWWRQPVWAMAAAASLVLLATLAVIWFKPSSQLQFADFRLAMMAMSRQKMMNLDFHSQDMAQIKDWLKAQHVAADFDVPASLNNAPVHGCKVIDWHGHKVTLLCFMPNGGGHFDLFVIDAARFRDFSPSSTPQFAASDGMTTAVWRSGDKTYLLGGMVDEEQLRKIL